MHKIVIAGALVAMLIATAATAQQQGLQGEYYLWTGGTPPGAPFLDYNRRGTHIDNRIYFEWGGNPPGIGGLTGQRFSIRWRGQVFLPEAGDWTFYMHTDDGRRLYINGELLFQNWSDSAVFSEQQATRNLSAGWHDIVVHYYQNEGGAFARLRFSGPGTSEQIIPQQNFRPNYGKGLLADYYNGNWGGAQTHVLSRNDGVINFNWGTGSPEPGITSNNFSARWRGKISVPTSGDYTFYVESNDGSALFVNGQELFNHLEVASSVFQSYEGTVALTGGRNYFVELRYNEFADAALCRLYWSGPGIAKEIIPEQRLLPILNEAPGDSTLTQWEVQSPWVAHERVGTLVTYDIDNETGAMPPQTHTYQLVSGVGAEVNGYFYLVGNDLYTREVAEGLDLGFYTIRVRATDDGETPGPLTSESVIQIEVTDSQPPVALCRDIEIALGSLGLATLTPAMVDDGSYDDVGIVAYELSGTQFNCADLGGNTITLTVFDDRGNYDACESVVTVVDNAPPTIASRNVTLFLDAAGEAHLTIEDVNTGTFDNCGLALLSLSRASFSCADLGVNEVTFFAEDVAGNVAQKNVVVTVRDFEPPVARTRNLTLHLAGGESTVITAADLDDGSADNCDVASMTLNQYEFGCAHLGANRVTLRVSDTAGNVATEDAWVTVVQDDPPIMACRDITVYLNDFGFIIIAPADIDAGSVDSCGFQSMTLSQSVFTCDDIGENLVVLTGTAHSGLSSECVATVRVFDITRPTLWFPGGDEVTVECGFPIVLPVPVISDNCHIETASILNFNGLDPASPALGEYEVVYGAQDSSGNVGAAILTVHVVDTIPPVLMSSPLFAECGVPFALPDGYVHDACGVVTMEVVESDGFDILHPSVGQYTATIKVTDQAGLSAEGVRSIQVRDTLPPEVVIPGQNPRYIPAGLAFTVPEAYGEDDCDGLLEAFITDLGGLDPSDPVLGAFVVSYETAPDSGGLVGVAELDVYVMPGTQPVLYINGNATPTYDCGVLYPEFGATAIDAEDGDITSSVVISGDLVDGSLLLPGVYKVHYHVVDSSGWPADRLTRTVTVRDNCSILVFAKNGKTRFFADPGASVRFEIIVRGAVGPVNYQWKKENASGTFQTLWGAPDAPFLQLTHLVEADAGRYVCEVTDTVTGALSPVFVLVIGAAVNTISLHILATLVLTLSFVGGWMARGCKSRQMPNDASR